MEKIDITEKDQGVWSRDHSHFYSNSEIEKGMKADKKFLRRILLEY